MQFAIELVVVLEGARFQPFGMGWKILGGLPKVTWFYARLPTSLIRDLLESWTCHGPARCRSGRWSHRRRRWIPR